MVGAFSKWPGCLWREKKSTEGLFFLTRVFLPPPLHVSFMLGVLVFQKCVWRDECLSLPCALPLVVPCSVGVSLAEGRAFGLEFIFVRGRG